MHPVTKPVPSTPHRPWFAQRNLPLLLTSGFALLAGLMLLLGLGSWVLAMPTVFALVVIGLWIKYPLPVVTRTLLGLLAASLMGYTTILIALPHGKQPLDTSLLLVGSALLLYAMRKLLRRLYRRG
ncbi:MAG: hypothetical protein M3Z04_01965 [Chloroflexota bacterium]|nr:hypothetical protein [Chloroflexota bacterium]